jgi:hypothetical protein
VLLWLVRGVITLRPLEVDALARAFHADFVIFAVWHGGVITKLVSRARLLWQGQRMDGHKVTVVGRQIEENGVARLHRLQSLHDLGASTCVCATIAEAASAIPQNKKIPFFMLGG